MAPEPAPTSRDGRVITIDLSRGLAILKDQISNVASFLRQEDLPQATRRFFLVVIYDSAMTLLSKVLGLLPRRPPMDLPHETGQGGPLERQAARGV